MSIWGKVSIAAIILIVGAVLAPRPPGNVSASRTVSQALRANKQSVSAPIDHIRQDLRQGRVPTLEGADTISGRDAWAIRLAIVPPKDHRKDYPRYPWLELWIDKQTSEILAWKEWGYSHDRHVVVLSQSPNTQ